MGVNGPSLKLTPTASKIALAIVCRWWNRRSFAGAQRLHRRSIDKNDFELGDIGKAQDRIGPPIEAGHAIGVVGHLFIERAADSLNYVAFDLAARRE